MKKKYLVFWPLLIILAILVKGCASISTTKSSDIISSYPKMEREFRAAWVATVANINWPSTPGLSTEEMKTEALHLLDLLKATNFNAVILQVRPQADALYKSELEPWSYYLTGEQGKAPDEDFDPLEFWIQEAHKRGMELHAWLNPYRAHHTTGGRISEYSVVNTKRELVVELKNGYWWFDPSLEETQKHSTAVVMDIVSRYNVDGIHFDDYFYPYPDYNNGEDFPDDGSWETYQAEGGKLSRGDWRRKAVDDFISNLYSSIKKEKPHVKFGLSPFGIWRPGYPSSIRGFDQHNVLYADAKKWINKGWIDYFTPQLYWPVNQIPQSFPVLLGWWNSQNTLNRFVWPGMSIGRLSGEKQIDEVINQIMITRGMNSNAPGTVHWSIAPLVEKDSLRISLKEGPYNTPALVPEMTWGTSSNPLPKPNIDIERLPNGTINVTPEKLNEDFSKWIVYTKYGNRWTTNTYESGIERFPVYYTKVDPSNKMIHILDRVEITYLNRFGKESKPYVFWTNHK